MTCAATSVPRSCPSMLDSRLLGGRCPRSPEVAGPGSSKGGASLSRGLVPSGDPCCPSPAAGSAPRGREGRPGGRVHRGNHQEPGRELLRPLLRPHRLPVGDRAGHAGQPGHHLRRGEGPFPGALGWASLSWAWGAGGGAGGVTAWRSPRPSLLPPSLSLRLRFANPRLKDHGARKVRRESPPSSSQ